MANSLKLIGTGTFLSNADAVEFIDIPQNFRDLQVIATWGDNTNEVLAVRFNDISTSTYGTSTIFNNAGTMSGANRASGTYIQAAGSGYAISGWNSYPGEVMVMDINEYSSTNKAKSLIIRGGGAVGGLHMSIANWSSTSAITKISIYSNNASVILAGSLFELWGIA